METPKIKFFDLQWAVGKIEHTKLTLFSSSNADDGVYEPANSFTVYGKANLERLRDELVEFLK